MILSPLEKAVDSRSRAIAQPKDEFIRDAVIQRFEYTYDLCWKLLRRRLAEDQGDAELEMLSRRELFRMATEYGLIEDPTPWFSYHKARNEPSHIYDEEKAGEVYGVALSFLADARALLRCLQEKTMIEVSPEVLDELRKLLRAHLPPDTHACAFGSRVSGNARPGSDLDILLEAPEPIPWSVLAELEETLAESDLPFRVDLLDRARTSTAFIQGIGTEKVQLI